RGADLDAYRYVEVSYHAPDHERLLVVLLPEVGDVRRAHVEQLRNDRRDSAKVRASTASGCAAQHVGEALDLDRGREAIRVDLGRRRRKKQVDARLGRERRVTALVTGIAFEVLAGNELSRVHEQARDHEAAFGARTPHEAEMTFVQEAHRGYERDAVRGFPRLGDRGPQPGNRAL